MSQNSDLQAEQIYIARAYRRIEAMRKAAQEMMEAALATPRGGTHQARAERDMIVRRSLSRLEQLEIGDQALCFGRIDIKSSDSEGETSFHIGRLAVADEDLEPLVVDWRAPVAEPFYRATGKEPMNLSRRRHFATEHQQIVAIEDEFFDAAEIEGELTPGSDELSLVGPGALFAAVTRSRTGRMRDIVATIQAQQDEIIRSPLSETLVVQGGPGTGKTAVALHRAAYLLYTYRMRLERQGVLVVAPSRIFARYVDQVLPSLGETGVEIMTIDGLSGFGEATLPETREEALLKGDLRMAGVLSKALRDRQRPLRHSEEIALGAFVVKITPKESEEVVRFVKRRGGSHNQRRKVVESLLAAKLAEKYLERNSQLGGDNEDAEDLLGEEVDFVSGSDAGDELTVKRDLVQRIQKSAQFQRMVQRIWPKLTPEVFLDDLFSHKPLIRLAGKKDLSEREIDLLFRPSQLGKPAMAWSRSDLVLLSEARVLLGTYKKKSQDPDEDRGFGHIIIDEAQDLSPIAARMIGRYSLSGSMTILGDIAQSTSPFGKRSWEEITAPLPKARSFKLVELAINYRTPQEVMDVAGALLARLAPELRTATSIRHSGEPVVVIEVDNADLAHSAATVVESELKLVDPGTVALLCPGEAKDFFAGELSNLGSLSADEGESRLSILSVEEAKGLEFDSVVIAQANKLLPGNGPNLQALYVAMTRTTKRLIFLDNKDLPEVLTDLVMRVN